MPKRSYEITQKLSEKIPGSAECKSENGWQWPDKVNKALFDYLARLRGQHHWIKRTVPQTEGQWLNKSLSVTIIKLSQNYFWSEKTKTFRVFLPLINIASLPLKWLRSAQNSHESLLNEKMKYLTVIPANEDDPNPQKYRTHVRSHNIVCSALIPLLITPLHLHIPST